MASLDSLFRYETPEEKAVIRRTTALLIILFLAALLYATLRYIIFGPYKFNAFPIFIMNKALALSFMMYLYILSSPYFKRVKRSLIGMSAYGMGIMHAMFSVILLPTSYLKKYYTTDGEMAVGFSAMIFFGIVALILMIIISKGFRYQSRYNKYWATFGFEKLFLMFLIVTGLHIFVFCINDWIRISRWYGYMPPVSLIAFIFLLGTTIHFFQRVFCKKK